MAKSTLQRRMQEKDTLFQTKNTLYYKDAVKKRKRLHLIRNLFVFLFCSLIPAFIYLPGILFPDYFQSNTLNSGYVITPDASKLYDLREFIKENPDLDLDNDGLSFAEEAAYNTDPWKRDTDNDGVEDKAEITLTGTNPALYVKDDFISRTLLVLQTENTEWNAPYILDGVTLIADSQESRAFGTVKKELSGTYRFVHFSGYAAFPSGEYAYKIEGDTFTLLSQTDKGFYISSDMEVIVLDGSISEVSRICFFDKDLGLIHNDILQKVVSVLPQIGFLTCEKTTTADVLLDDKMVVSYSGKDYIYTVKMAAETSKNSTTRFSYTQEKSDLDTLYAALDEKQIAFCSLLSPTDGEIIGIIYGYTENGNLLIASTEGESIGEIEISLYYASFVDLDGNIVLRTEFSFSGLGFCSDDGDHVSFYGYTPVISEPKETTAASVSATPTPGLFPVTPTETTKEKVEPSSTTADTPPAIEVTPTPKPTIAPTTVTPTPMPTKTPTVLPSPTPDMLPTPIVSEGSTVSASEVKTMVLSKINSLAGTNIPVNGDFTSSAQAIADANGQNTGSLPEGTTKAVFTISKSGAAEANVNTIISAIYPVYFNGHTEAIGAGITETSSGYYVVVLIK